eukprot:scaffold2926_cov247-Pinguiococcus_pyrenoidosus.AAC.2
MAGKIDFSSVLSIRHASGLRFCARQFDGKELALQIASHHRAPLTPVENNYNQNHSLTIGIQEQEPIDG